MPERRPIQPPPTLPPPAATGPARLGPRPLPLHLMAHVSMLMGSRAALPLLKNGSLPWRPALATRAEALRQSLEHAGPDAWTRLDAALTAEGAARHGAVLAGIEAYRHHPYARDLPEAPVAWREGTTLLRDYRTSPGGQPVLVVPSLVNRAYILDLTRRRSLMRALAARGLAPFLLDWDAPGAEEIRFTLGDYVARLGRAVAATAAIAGRDVAMVGYCMGGNLALALAATRTAPLTALALLATPWDFHAGHAGPAALTRALAEPLGALIERLGYLPTDLLSAMFATLDPTLVARKFAAFGQLRRSSARARNFVALEDWANDGVALAGAVARECLFGWYGHNTPAKGHWRIGGLPVLPQRVTIPTLVVMPERDRIVPLESAAPLGLSVPRAKVMRLRAGHVGMLLSARAGTELYAPLARWLVRAAVQ